MAAHKFRTNIDGLTIAGGASAGIHSKSPLTPYVTVIFCEHCGYVKYDTNRSHKQVVEPSADCPATPQPKKGE